MAMKSEYLITLADPSQLPDLFKGPFLKGRREPRVVMVGRSNVGKSSLINALLKEKLAQTSNQPGKTRALHFYFWSEAKKIIVDLPGYGYARAAKQDREKWKELIDHYLGAEENLDRAIILLDARHGPTEGDLDAIRFLSLKGIPVTFVFSKVDTLKTQSLRASRLKEATLAFKTLGLQMDRAFWVSSRTSIGMRQLSADLMASTSE